ncbi:hypothetical protein JQX13_15300 [Archangium violaceum]|uniref:hypothetical protein n=1 Tax=Archangium violaceum TaxID=83451 RepID=UPI00193BA5B3|nr:hypothetical protein [Archangium violaceum]QRK11316.1 hypothetical protein JQX13_15300 [Archangium violaceum]
MSHIRKWLGVGSALVGLMVVGCGGSIEEPTPGNEPQRSEAVAGEVAASGCGDYGWWTCPDDGFDWLYFACPSNEDLNRLEARDVCNASCVATCVDSGWIRG